MSHERQTLGCDMSILSTGDLISHYNNINMAVVRNSEVGDTSSVGP